MILKRVTFSTTLILVLAVLACGPAPAAPTSAPTAAPAAPASAPTVAPTQLPAAPTAVATKPAATAPAAGGTSASELSAKALKNAEYSVDFKLTSASQTVSGTMFVKPNKIRQQMTTPLGNTVLLVDVAGKVAYLVMVEQKTALKMDFAEASSQLGETPGDRIGGLSPDAKYLGTETIDGKAAAVYQNSPPPQGSSKIWIWIETGMPLKTENTTPAGNVVMEFANYKFGPQPDSLFELPPGTQVTDFGPGMMPGTPGTPGVPVKPGVPAKP